jgi:hypothetical protein
MQYKTELKPFKEKEGQKYKVIQLTDLKLHTAPKRPTPSFGKKVREAFQQNTPGRVYNTLPKPMVPTNDNSFILEILKLDPDFMSMIQEEEAKGYKVLISVPKEGVPVLLGEDTIEFLESKNGKRLLRKLDKNKN